MIKIKRNFLKGLVAVMLILFTALSPILSPKITSYAANTDIKFDDTNVLDDLRSSTSDGNAFNILDYPFDSSGLVKHPEIINVVEYCYSFKVNMQSNYGLYLYFYNPQGLNIDTKNKSNKVQLAVSYDMNGTPKDYEKFDLVFCSRSTEKNYANLFYKFKVKDHKSVDGKTVLQRVNSNERRYDLSGVELVTTGKNTAEDYTIGGTYKFVGYVKGYGSDSTAENNLVSSVNDLETIRLDVRSTNFRTNSSSVGKDHQNELNSVYFSVDNTIMEKYGKLQKVKAEWYEYKTAPIVVTEDNAMFDTLQSYVGKPLQGGYDSTLPYKLGYDHNVISISPTLIIDYGWSYNAHLMSSLGTQITSQNVCNQLNYLFSSGGQSVKDYEVSSEEMYKYIYGYDKSFVKGKLPIKRGDISADLFESTIDSDRIAKGYNVGKNIVEIDADSKFDMFSYNDQNHDIWDRIGDYGLWNTLFGKTPSDDNISGVVPIEDITDTLMTSDNRTISNNLLINEKDIDGENGFKSYYNTAKSNNKTTYLFRFAVTDYFSGLLYGENANAKPVVMKDKSYMAQETVFLDFDILQLTFNKDGVYKVIPVVSNPIDIINGITLPIIEDGCNGINWFMLVILVILLLICAPFLPPIITVACNVIGVIFNILLFPFRAISKTIKKNKKIK